MQKLRAPSVRSICRLKAVQMGVLILIVAAGAFSRTTVGPLQEAIRNSFGLSDNQISLLQGPALAIPLVAISLPLGILIDSYSRARLMLVLSLTSLVGTVITALASNFPLLMAARCIVGAAGLAVNPVALSLISDLFVARARGRATMGITMGQVLGASSAFELGGLLLARHLEPGGWQIVMLWLTVPLVVAVGAAWILFEPARMDIGEVQIRHAGRWRELRHYQSIVVPLLSATVCAEIAMGAIITWTAPMLSRRFLLPPDRVGALLATALMVSGLCGPMLGGVIADVCQRLGGSRRTAIVLGGISFLSAPFGLFALVHPIALSASMLVASLTLVTAVAVMGTTLFTIVIPNEIRGLCMAILAASSVMFGLGVAPMTVSITASLFGYGRDIGPSLAIVTASAALVGGILFLLSARAMPPGVGVAQAAASNN